MKLKTAACAAALVSAAACGSMRGDGKEMLRGQLQQAQTAAKLSAENTKRLEGMYSDIYFELDSLTVESFKARVAAGETLFVYIGRPNCGDCSAFEPMFKRYIAARRLGGKIYFVNVHRLHQNKAAWEAFKQQYGLSGTPVLAKYAKGRQDNELDFEDNGGITAADLEAWLDKNGL